MTTFQAFPKIYRLNREVVVTEKIDGTNACVVVTEAATFDERIVTAQSRSRLITPEDDNYGFAAWVRDNAATLRQLGPGYHFGEWWGAGIQRRYGLAEKRFSLFNVTRWGETRPACCHVVPVIRRGIGFGVAELALEALREHGSYAAPGFDRPEGIIAFHAPSNTMLKATLEKAEEHKGKGPADA
jgi:hypothetical protein